MAQTVCVLVSARDRQRLEAITSDRNRQRKHIERAQVVLSSVGDGPVQQTALQIGVTRPMVWRWQQRFAEEGVDGLLHDKTRKPGKPPIAAETVARVVALTCADPPHQASHWTGRAMAKATGISLRSVQRIWEAHQLQRHDAPVHNGMEPIEALTQFVGSIGLDDAAVVERLETVLPALAGGKRSQSE